MSKPSAINLPNALSWARLLATPLIAWLIAAHRLEAALYVFVAAGITDALDGYLARRLKLQTDLGRIIDPLADKALLATTYLMLGITEPVGLSGTTYLPWWIVALVIGRDVLIVAAWGVSNMFGFRIKPEPIILSKINTALQILLAATALLYYGFALDFIEHVMLGLLWATAISTVLSWAQYLFLWLITRGTMEKR